MNHQRRELKRQLSEQWNLPKKDISSNHISDGMDDNYLRLF